MNSIRFVSSNLHKIREAQEIFKIPIISVKMDLQEIQAHDIKTILQYKIAQAWQIVQSPVFVEDTSLIFRAWKTLPGPYVKWFWDSVGALGMWKMLAEFEDKSAIATCHVAYMDGGEAVFFEGTVFGQIVEPQGNAGFGWDQIFMAEGCDCTFAQMSAEEKNRLSMRKMAFAQLNHYLTQS